MKEKNITINELATAIENLFGIMKAGFEKMNKRFDRIEAKIDCIERKCEATIAQLDNIARHDEHAKPRGKHN